MASCLWEIIIIYYFHFLIELYLHLLQRGNEIKCNLIVDLITNSQFNYEYQYSLKQWFYCDFGNLLVYTFYRIIIKWIMLKPTIAIFLVKNLSFKEIELCKLEKSHLFHWVFQKLPAIFLKKWNLQNKKPLRFVENKQYP